MLTYVLNDNGEPVAEPNISKWAEWFQFANRSVANEYIGDSRISTVFLGVDHSFGITLDDGPVIWETMVFGGLLDGEQDRCNGDRARAEEMHRRMISRVACRLRCVGNGNGSGKRKEGLNNG